jgi:hypothetical protein
MVSQMPQTRKVIGIAMDGHAILGTLTRKSEEILITCAGPYDNNGLLIQNGYDVCNGMFYDAIGNYAYVSTNTVRP